MTTPPPRTPAATGAAGAARLPRKEAPTLLRMVASLILGLTDPLPMPSPMSEAEGAWVRAHAWTPALRRIDDEYPYGFHRWCACQRGTCWNCRAERCDLCVHRQHGGPNVDDVVGAVTDGRGFVVARIVHLPHQRPCRWVCACPCPKTGPAPEPPHEQRRIPTHPPKPAVPAPAGQLDLFEETAP